MDQPGKVANPARGQLNRENNIPLSPCYIYGYVYIYIHSHIHTYIHTGEEDTPMLGQADAR